MKRFIIFSLLQLISFSIVRAGEVTATAEWAIYFPKNSPSTEVLNINFKEKGNPAGPVLDLTKGSPLNKSSYKLVATNGDSTQAVDILEIIPIPKHGNTATALNIVLKALPKKDVTYALKVDTAAWQFLQDVHQPTFKPVELKLDNANLQLDQTFLTPRSLNTKAEIAGGTTGIVSLLVHSGLTNFNDDSLLSADLSGKADFSLLSKDKTKYFNSVVGELKVFNAFEWNKANEDFTGFFEWGASSRVESDQTFGTVNGTVGAAAGSYIKNPLTTFLHGNIVKLLQGKEIQEAGVAPYLFVSYDYVDNWKRGVTTNTGNERIRLDFSWSLPLLRGLEFPKTLGLTQQLIDADFLVDVEAIYDEHSSKVMDNSKLALEFRPQAATDKSPSFTLTYAQGKATPTFKNVDAFLAGLKIPF